MYHEQFGEFASNYWQRQLRPGYDGTGKFGDWLGLTVEEYRECKLAYRQGGGKRTMPLHPGAQNFVKTLRNLEAEIWLTTTRPYLRLDSTDPDTRFWLETHGIKYDYLLYDADKYEKLYSSVDPGRVVMVLDDLPEQVEAATNLFGNAAWMIHRTSNNTASYQKVRDLHAASDLSRELVLEWRAR